MRELWPWSSLRAVECVLADSDSSDVREWLAAHWTAEFLEGDPAVVRRLLPYMDLSRISGRAALVLFAVDQDWVDVLDRAEEACGFLPAFWRDAFARAQRSGSVRCVSWLLDRKGSVIGGEKVGLEL